MPVRFVADDQVDLYATARGNEVLQKLRRGDRVDLDGSIAPSGGRQRVIHGELAGWIDSGKLAPSGTSLVAAARRSGTTLPEPKAPSPPPVDGMNETTSDDSTEPEPSTARDASAAPSVRPPPLTPSERLDRRAEVVIFGGWMGWTIGYSCVLLVLFYVTPWPVYTDLLAAFVVWMFLYAMFVARRPSTPRRHAR